MAAKFSVLSAGEEILFSRREIKSLSLSSPRGPSFFRARARIRISSVARRAFLRLKPSAKA